jgi:hypothetical protein
MTARRPAGAASGVGFFVLYKLLLAIFERKLVPSQRFETCAKTRSASSSALYDAVSR